MALNSCVEEKLLIALLYVSVQFFYFSQEKTSGRYALKKQQVKHALAKTLMEILVKVEEGDAVSSSP